MEDESGPESKSAPLEKEKDKEEASTDESAPKVEGDETEQPSETKTEIKKGKDWVVVLGGASSVGKYAIQVRHPYNCGV